MLNLDNIFNKFYPKSQTAGTGRKLYIMAWAIEIFVAMVGLTMAYIFFQKAGTDTNSVGATSDRSDGIIVALSFVVVAIMEITKIPLATALYYAGRLNWKILFLVALIFVNFSTFETMVQGFDTFYHKRIKVVNTVRIEKESLEGQILNLSKKKNQSSSIAEKIKNANLKIDNYNIQIAEVEKQAGDAISNIEKQSASANPRIESIIKEIKDYQDTINKKEDQKRDTLLTIKDAKGGAFGLGKGAEQKRMRDDIARIDVDIRAINLKIDKLRADERNLQGKSVAQSEPEIKNIIQSKNRQISLTNSQKDAVFKNELQPLQSEQNKIAQNQNIYNEQQAKLNDSLEAKKDELRSVASDNQVYRFALKIKVLSIWWNSWGIFSDNAEDKTKKEITNLEKIRDRMSNEHVNKVTDLEKKALDAGANIAKIQQIDKDKEFAESNFSNSIKKIDKQIEDANRNLSNIRTLSFGGSIDESDLTQSDISAAFWLWFGTLSAVISVIGTLIALASLHLQDERMHEIRNRPIKHSLAKLMKRLSGLVLFLSRYIFRSAQNLLKPRIVETIIEKEVEVEIEKIVDRPIVEEKIVYQKVEVPKEVTRKEIVHVPLWTQDPDLLNKKYDISEDTTVTKKKK